MGEIVKIEKLVYGGDGISRLADGRAVFVPFVVPGEELEIKIAEDKSRFARAVATRWVHESPERIPPDCPYFGICGGCHYQHMPYSMQLETKRETVADQLQRIGGFELERLTEINIVPSPKPWAYRNQIQLNIAEDGTLGFMRADNNGVLPVAHCPIAMPGLNELLGKLILEPESGISRVSFREDTDGELFILFEGQEELPPEMTLALEVSAGYLNAEQAYHQLAGTDQLRYSILGKDFSVSPASFFQVNIAVAKQLLKKVLELVKATKAQNVLELYSGVGLFSAFIAPLVSHLIAIEASPSACYDFANNLDEFENVSLYEGPVEHVLPSLVSALKSDKPDLVLLDPPRAGLHPKALDALAELAPEQIIYVSCDPSTLARDLKRLAKHGYDCESIHCFDMFPQTYHVETAVLITRVDK